MLYKFLFIFCLSLCIGDACFSSSHIIKVPSIFKEKYIKIKDIKNGGGIKYDYSSVYRHVEEVVQSNKPKKRLIKLNSEKKYFLPINLNLFVAATNRSKSHPEQITIIQAENIIREELEKINRLTGVKLYLPGAQEKVSGFYWGVYFIKDKSSLKKYAYYFNRVIEKKGREDALLATDRLYNSLTDNYSNTSYYMKWIGVYDRRLQPPVLVRALSHVLIYMDQVQGKDILTLKKFKILMQRALYYLLIDKYEGSVINYTYSSINSKENIEFEITEFDKAFLKAVYSKKLPHGMFLKNAVKPITNHIFTLLGR